MVETLETFSELVGKTLKSIVGKVGGETLVFELENGDKYQLYHQDDCCESVDIYDIIGDLEDLVDSPILLADESSSRDRPDDVPAPEYHEDSQTWTFYRIQTLKGLVVVRWFGSSNGYYSEEVSFGLVSHANEVG